MSPATDAYLDMKYERGDPARPGLGGNGERSRAYDWDPATLLPGVGEDDVLGVEAPLWSETDRDGLPTRILAFPRLPGTPRSAGRRGWGGAGASTGGGSPRTASVSTPSASDITGRPACRGVRSGLRRSVARIALAVELDQEGA